MSWSQFLGEAWPSECDELAEGLSPPADAKSWDDVHRYVWSVMRDATETVVDNVTEALWLRLDHATPSISNGSKLQ